MGDFGSIILLVIVAIIVVLIADKKSRKKNIGRRRISRLFFRRTSESIGNKGEFWVKYMIGETIENERYVINNLTLEHDGKSSQIDHIVINQRGVFVIETKNYSGQIYGNENQQEWTQVLSYGKVKNKLYNPLKQNATHIYNVKRIIGNLPIRSLVVFVQDNTQNIDAPDVIPLKKLNHVLDSGESVLSCQEMRTAYDALLENKSDITKEEHIQNIKEQQFNLRCGYCPRCGNKLIIKTGKYGEFWGCSNYPKCKFIKNIHKY